MPTMLRRFIAIVALTAFGLFTAAARAADPLPIVTDVEPQPLFAQVRVLFAQTAHLARSRDLLLLRLISGRLSVDALDIAFPASMKPPPPCDGLVAAYA